MEKNTKRLIPLFILIGVVLVAAAAYITVFHIGMPTRDYSGPPANGWLGLWQGLIIYLSFIASWFDNNIVLYQANNDGFWYNFGYLIGAWIAIGAFAGGSRARASRTKSKPTTHDWEARPPSLLLFAGIAVAFAWLLFVGLWLFFYASGLSSGENAGIFIISLAVVAIVETVIWVPWGTKQPSWGKSER